jgi:4-carboxymuconolactone decarboxylase
MTDSIDSNRTPADETLYERGMRFRKMTHGDEGEVRRSRMEKFCPDIANNIVEFAFGKIFSRPGLDLRTRELLAVAAHTMRCDRLQIEIHIKNALNVGCTPQEILETVIEMCLYGGFPVQWAGATCAMNVFEQRRIWNEDAGWVHDPNTPWKTPAR